MNIIPYKDNISEVRKISYKIDKPCFFGYYDLMAYDVEDKYHLCNIIDFENRLQTGNDFMELGVIDLQNGNYEKQIQQRRGVFSRERCFSGADHRKTLFFTMFLKTAGI